MRRAAQVRAGAGRSWAWLCTTAAAQRPQLLGATATSPLGLWPVEPGKARAAPEPVVLRRPVVGRATGGGAGSSPAPHASTSVLTRMQRVAHLSLGLLWLALNAVFWSWWTPCVRRRRTLARRHGQRRARIPGDGTSDDLLVVSRPHAAAVGTPCAAGTAGRDGHALRALVRVARSRRGAIASAQQRFAIRTTAGSSTRGLADRA